MPFYESARTGSFTVFRIGPQLAVEMGRFQTVIEQIAHDAVSKKLHPAIGVMDNKPFASSEQLVRNHEGSDGIIGGAAAGVADHVCVTFGKACVFRRVQPRIHAGEDGKSTSGRQRQILFGAEARRIFLVGGNDFIDNFGYGILSLMRRQ